MTDPLELLQLCAETYRLAESYRDSGVVQDSGRYLFRRYEDKATFTTIFARPDHLKCEFFRGDALMFAVWNAGNGPRTWSGWRNKVDCYDWCPKEHTPIGLAIASATGVTRGTAYIITRLLLPDQVEGRLLTAITESEMAGHETVDDHDCWVVKGKLAGSACRVWFDKDSYIIRRVTESFNALVFNGEKTIDIKPELNVPIDPDAFQFAPPDAAG